VGLVSMMGFEHTRNELSVRNQSCLWESAVEATDNNCEF